MKIEISGTFTVEHFDEEAWQAFRGASETETMARIQETSRLSGMEVVRDLTMFDIEWSPVYRYGSTEPVAWVHNSTGERRAGAEMPTA